METRGRQSSSPADFQVFGVFRNLKFLQLHHFSSADRNGRCATTQVQDLTVRHGPGLQPIPGHHFFEYRVDVIRCILISGVKQPPADNSGRAIRCIRMLAYMTENGVAKSGFCSSIVIGKQSPEAVDAFTFTFQAPPFRP